MSFLLTSYVPIDHVSGTSEAFLHAVANENQLKRSNDSLLLFSAIYIVLNVLLIRSAGAVGLIAANILSILFKYGLLFLNFICLDFETSEQEVQVGQEFVYLLSFCMAK